MPRKARRAPAPGDQGGYGAQPAVAPTGMPYGAHQASIESQQALPLAAVSDTAAPAPMDRQARLARAVEIARRMRPPEPLTGPTRRPMEPITAGLPMGAGPGPEVLRTGSRTVRSLRLLAEATGDPLFAELADKASLRGR